MNVADDTDFFDNRTPVTATDRPMPTVGGHPLHSLSVLELLELRAFVDSLLPAASLNQMNLETELVVQFQFARALQNTILAADEEPSKKASVMNACASALQNLVKMQAEHHTAERLKNIEQRLVKALQKVPEEYLREFFDWYEKGMQ